MQALISDLFDKLKLNGWMIATAESCTGGMIAAAITDISGSSAYFDRGFVTYTNQSKIDLLGVSPETLQNFGAVSMQTAEEMAIGAIKHSMAQTAISITGIAGPSGGTDDKPVGLVFIGTGIKGKKHIVTKNIFSGDRSAIRAVACETAIKQMIGMMS